MSTLEDFLQHYQLQPKHRYLLELVPLFKMIWADGINQPEEIAILQRYATDHLARLAERNAGVMPVSVAETNDFIERFTATEPSAQMLDELSQLCFQRLREHSDIEYSRRQAETLIDFCIDIAAACAAGYPFEFDERIIDQEKQSLRALMQLFGALDSKPS